MSKFLPHVMRHTAITMLVQSGADLPTIQRISGHKTLAMVMRYTHVHGPHIDQAIRALGRGIREPLVNKLPKTATPKLHVLRQEYPTALGLDLTVLGRSFANQAPNNESHPIHATQELLGSALKFVHAVFCRAVPSPSLIVTCFS